MPEPLGRTSFTRLPSRPSNGQLQFSATSATTTTAPAGASGTLNNVGYASSSGYSGRPPLEHQDTFSVKFSRAAMVDREKGYFHRLFSLHQHQVITYCLVGLYFNNTGMPPKSCRCSPRSACASDFSARLYGISAVRRAPICHK